MSWQILLLLKEILLELTSNRSQKFKIFYGSAFFKIHFLPHQQNPIEYLQKPSKQLQEKVELKRYQSAQIVYTYSHNPWYPKKFRFWTRIKKLFQLNWKQKKREIQWICSFIVKMFANQTNTWNISWRILFYLFLFR